MKNKPIPYYCMEGIVFEVDIHEQRLIERANPQNIISFPLDMIDKESHYELAFDRHTKNKYTGDPAIFNSDLWVAVIIPKLAELDPEGMAEKYGYTVEQMRGKTDREIIVNQELLAQRQSGIIPQIRIGEDWYHVVVREHELWAAGHQGRDIHLKEMTVSEDLRAYSGYYHTIQKKLVAIDPKLTELPKDVVLIEIPSEMRLDPVDVARIYGMEVADVVRQYPIIRRLEAKLTPLSETGLPKLIEPATTAGKTTKKIKTSSRPLNRID